MIGQIEEQQTLMAEMILEMQNRDTQLSLMPVSYTHLLSLAKIFSYNFMVQYPFYAC